MLLPLDIPPGVVRTRSENAAKGRFTDCDHTRFVNGQPEKWLGCRRMIGGCSGHRSRHISASMTPAPQMSISHSRTSNRPAPGVGFMTTDDGFASSAAGMTGIACTEHDDQLRKERP